MKTLLNKNLKHTEIVQLFKEKKVDKDWSFDGFKPSDTGKWTHCYHRYPAKFIPQLVEALIQEYIVNENAHINDPFMGSGTTIVTAISKGLKASGTDINRIAYLITKVKATPIEPNYLDKKINQILAFQQDERFGDYKSLLIANVKMNEDPESREEPYITDEALSLIESLNAGFIDTFSLFKVVKSIQEGDISLDYFISSIKNKKGIIKFEGE